MQNNDLKKILKKDLELLTERIEIKEKEIEDNNNTLDEMYIQEERLKRYIYYCDRN